MTRPLNTLLNSVGKNVIIQCKDGSECSGKMTAIDEFMNVILKKAQQRRNGHSQDHEIILLRGTQISIIQLWDDKNAHTESSNIN